MDPQVEALIQAMAAQAQANGAPAMNTLPAADARANAEVSFDAFNQPMPASVRTEDRHIPGPARDIPVKVFTPEGAGPFPLVVYFHGGGWVIGSPHTHRRLCAQFAESVGAVVVSVHYRLAPEHKAPAALDDCIAATRWAIEHAAELNADGSRYALAGDSAGGNLVLASALVLRDAGDPQARLLLGLYGTYDLEFDKDANAENTDGPILTMETMRWFKDHYVGGSGIPDEDPRVSPLRGDLAGLPPARLIVGTMDPLRDDSVLVAEKIERSGGKVTLSIYDDMPHLFLQLDMMLDGGKKGVAEAVGALREALA